LIESNEYIKNIGCRAALNGFERLSEIWLHFFLSGESLNVMKMLNRKIGIFGSFWGHFGTYNRWNALYSWLERRNSALPFFNFVPLRVRSVTVCRTGSAE